MMRYNNGTKNGKNTNKIDIHSMEHTHTHTH